MDKGVEAIGKRLGRATKTLTTTRKRKEQSLCLGIVLGLKASLDALGESEYGYQCIQKALDDSPNKKIQRGMNSILGSGI